MQPSSHSIWLLRIAAAALWLVGGACVRAALPMLPPRDNSENIIFQDDFSNGNLKGWSNLSSASGAATIGVDPGGTGTAWYPSVDADQVGVASTVTLPVALNLTDGPVAVYMRVRVEGGNSVEGNRFNVSLTEKTPNNRYGTLIIRPGSQAHIGYRNSSGANIGTPTDSICSFPAASTYHDFRLVFSKADSGTVPPADCLKLEAYYYHPTTLAYVSMGTVPGGHLSSGIFNQLGLSARNSTGRAYFDSVMVTQAGGPRASAPANAYRPPFPLPAGMTIQSALDAYQTVVLSKGDYPSGAAILLRSGQQLYGDQAGTSIPSVTVEPGTTGAVLRHVKVAGTGTLTFPASSLPTRGNVFANLTCKMVVTGATLQDNLFLDIVGATTVDTSAGGYLRNNRFIRTKTHAVSNQLVMLGDSQRSSYGNVFLWKNFLTPGGDATNVTNQGDLTFVGVDAESWNISDSGTGAALWKVGRMGTLRIFGMNGGNNIDTPTGIFDVDADEFQLYNDLMSRIDSTLIDYQLGANNLRSLLVNAPTSGKVWTNAATSPFRLKGFDGGSTDVSTTTSSTTTPEWTTRTGNLPTLPSSPDQQAILRAMVVHPTRAAGQVPWEAPGPGPLPDPAGPNWAADLSSKPDSTGYIQNLINMHGVARLPAGVYYISQPLKLSNLQGIIGAGADTTVIIAKSNTLDMIVANDPVTAPTGTSITLADITLQGGKNGIHLEPVGTSSNLVPPIRRAQYTACAINHVTFRNMSTAGIFMDRIYALDNIFFGNVHFVNCDTGLKQLTDPLYAGGDAPDDPHAARMMYMDKCAFYECRFVGNRIAMQLPGGRGCNLNAWINCLFQNNSGGVAAMSAYLTSVFANCDFINNGGTAVVSNNITVSHVSNRFVAGSAGVAMFGGPVSAEGCSFDRTGSVTAKILNGGNGNVFLNNCTAANMPLGQSATASGMLINTTLGMDPTLNEQVISLKSGTRYTLLPGTPAPAPQLLVGSDWSVGPSVPDPSNLTILAHPAQLSWQDHSSDETGFRIERKVGVDGSWVALTNVAPNITTFTDPGPFTPPAVYFYRVVATTAAGDSGYSNLASFQASAGFISLPTSTLTVDSPPGLATIHVTRLGGATGAVSVDYATSDSSAIAGIHFTSSSGTLAWADGEMGVKNITVSVLNDAVPRQARQFRLTLAGPGGGAGLGTYPTMAVLIEDPTLTLPAPWSQIVFNGDNSVADTSPAGVAEGVMGSPVLGGSGLSAPAIQDNGRFIYQTRTGDGVLAASVQVPVPAQTGARFAVMVRDGGDGTSKMAATVTSGDGGFGSKLVYRIASPSNSVLTGSATAQTTPRWIRIARMGDVFISEISADGNVWITLGSATLVMPATAQWGLFHLSSGSADYQLATFQNVTCADLPVPSAPAGWALTTPTVSSVKLIWSASDFAAGYRIERRAENSDFALLSEITSGATLFTDTTVASASAYQYRILAYNSTGGSAWSPVVAVSTPNGVNPVVRPGFLAVDPGVGGGTGLSWFGGAPGATGYQLERRAANGAWILLQSLPANATGFTDITALPGVIYEYRLRAMSATGSSSWATTTSLLHAGVATVGGAVRSIDSVIFNQFDSTADRSYVPPGFIYAIPPRPLVTGQTEPALRNDQTAWLGMKFTVGASPLIIHELGRWVGAGNSATHTVKLVNAATGTDVPGGSVAVATAGAPVGFKYAKLAAPLTLAANTTYCLVSEETSGGDPWYDGSCALTYPAGLVTVTTPIWCPDGTTYYNGYGSGHGANTCYCPLAFTWSTMPPAPFATSHGMTLLRNDASGWFGMKLTVGASDIRVSQLGRWVVPGNSASHAVKLVNATTGADLATVTVATAGAPGGQFQYAPLATAVTLPANASYYLLSQEAAGGDQWYDFASPAAGTATGYQSWLLLNGLPMDESDSGSAAPANDNLPNLVKFALGLSPAISGNGGHLGYGKTTFNGSDYLTFTYIRPEPAPDGITCTVEASPDISTGNWSSSGLTEISSTVSAGLRSITVRDAARMTDAGKRFMRLKINQP